ncbi:Hsp70 family protein [Nocardia heshunensis]
MTVTVGIDLGTTNCCVAVPADADIPDKAGLIERGRLRPLGGVLIVTNPDLSLTTPSAVWVAHDGTALVGAPAKRKARVPGAPPAMFFKRLMGTDQTVRAGHAELTAVQASTMLLRHLKQTAEDALGVTIDRAVITVPAYFEASAKTSTAEAGRQAGLEVAETLIEPFAAALAHRYLQEEPEQEPHRLLVYDLGGGTFDTSVVLWDPEEGFTGKSFDGDRYLGGYDFDQAIVDWMIERLPAYDLAAEPGDPQDSERQAWLLSLAERAKHDLSWETESEIVDDSLEDRSGQPMSINLTIGRTDFEARIGAYLRDTIELCDSALRKARVRPDQLDEVILVGGSSRIPLVSTLLERHFGKPPRILHPELVVAIGAALKAGSFAYRRKVLELDRPIPLETTVDISGRVLPDVPATADTVVVLRPSGQREPVDGDGSFQFLDVPLDDTATFTIQVLRDEVEVATEAITVSRERADPFLVKEALAHDFSIERLDHKLLPIAKAGTTIPHRELHRFQTATTGSTLTVRLYEGLVPIGFVQIRDLPADLPPGSVVEVAFEFAADWTIRVDVELPGLNRSATGIIDVPKRQVPGWTELRQRAAKLEDDWKQARREGHSAEVAEAEPEVTRRLTTILPLLHQQRDPAKAHHLLLEIDTLLGRLLESENLERYLEPPPSQFHGTLHSLRGRIEELGRHDLTAADAFLHRMANLESEGLAARASRDLIRWRRVNRSLEETLGEIWQIPFIRDTTRMPADTIKQRLLEISTDIDETITRRHLELLHDSGLDSQDRGLLPDERDTFRDKLTQVRGAIAQVQTESTTARTELLRLHDRLAPLQRAVAGWRRELGIWEGLGDSTSALPAIGKALPVTDEALPVIGNTLPETGENLPRYVNIAVTRRGGGPPMPRQVALAVAGQYLLRISIGDIDVVSLVDRPTAFPADQLPVSNEGHWLSASLSSSQLLIGAEPIQLFLPRTGPAWVCACTPGNLAHTCGPATRSLFAYVPFTAPPVKTRARLRVGLYFGATIVQTFVLTISVERAEIPSEPASVLCDYSLTPDLDDIAGLPRRDVSALADSDGGTHHLLITRSNSDATTTTVVASLGDGARTDLVRAVRAALLTMHVEDIEVGMIYKRRRLRNRYQQDNSAFTLEQFRADLRRLAVLGRALWTGLFGTIVSGGEIMHEIARTAGLRMQIAAPATSRFVFPWAVVYDIPLQSVPESFHDCPVLSTWDLTARHTPLLPDGRCPYADHHDIDTICPSGFWGYRHLIDQPVPAEGTRVTTVVSTGSTNAAAVAGIGTAGLVAESVQAHMRTVERAIGRPLTQCGRTEDLRSALAHDDVAVVYFFCHGRWRPGPTGSIESRLELDEGQIVAAGDLLAWKQVWGQQHWPGGGPLVFVNGCHTLDVTPDSVTDLVAGFSRIGASGVIGTETTVHQNLAAEAGEIFWRAIVLDQSSAGESLRKLRHSLLAKGNLLGLAYTAYCATELRIR